MIRQNKTALFITVLKTLYRTKLLNCNQWLVIARICAWTEIYELELTKFVHQLQNNKLPKLFQDLFCKTGAVHCHNIRHVTKNIYFRRRAKKCITQNLLAFRESKLRINVDDVYKNKEFSTATFKNHHKKFLISKC